MNRNALNVWLVEQQRVAGNGSYHARFWSEDASRRTAVMNELRAYFQEALDDARRRLRSGFEDHLSPFTDSKLDPADNYPSALHRFTLQGYLGETFAALAVEHWDIHGRRAWQVPALLFRFHDVEFQHLERINQRFRGGQRHDSDEDKERRPGRTGDDAIAFIKDSSNSITHVLTLEAKCLSNHRSETLNEAHGKLISGPFIPDSIRELVELLNDYDTLSTRTWQEALIKYRASAGHGVVRYDAVVYVCGNRPQRGRTGWISPKTANANYSAARNLAGLEYHVEDLVGLVDTIYRT
jgi:hypothetical protein